MGELWDVLWLRTWWEWNPKSADLFDRVYRGFNLFEAGVWFVFAWLVARRAIRHRRSPIEWWYALAFFAFGLTDVREAWVQSSWLIWLKGANLAVLLSLRHIVIRRHYPESRIY